MKLPGLMALAWMFFISVTVHLSARVTTAGPAAWATVSLLPSSDWTTPLTGGVGGPCGGAGWPRAGSASPTAQAAAVSETMSRRMMLS